VQNRGLHSAAGSVDRGGICLTRNGGLGLFVAPAYIFGIGYSFRLDG
jgi:hypothetical protein